VTLLTALVPLAFVAACPTSMTLFRLLRNAGWADPAPVFVGMLAFGAPLALWIAAAIEKSGRSFTRGARIEADKTLVLGDARARIALRDLVSGMSDGRDSVVIDARDGVRYTIAVGAILGARWLEALGVSAAHKVFRARFHRVFNQLLFWMIGAPSLIGLSIWVAHTVLFVEPWRQGYGVQIGLGGLAFGLLVSLWTSLFVMGSTVTVGADGLVVRDGVRRRFIAYADLAFVGVGPTNTLDVTYRDGRREHIWVDGDVGTKPEVLHDRVHQAWKLSRRESATVPAQLLSRHGRSIAEWRETLARLLSSDSGYRSVTVDAEALARVLRDATAPIEQRIAAALALGSSETTREQVRVAAATIVNEPVRVAIESAADGSLDDERYEQAVESARVRVAVS
jgi:hypothetical protein